MQEVQAWDQPEKYGQTSGTMPYLMESEAHSRHVRPEVNRQMEKIDLKRPCTFNIVPGVSGPRLGLGSLSDQTGQHTN